MRDHNGVGLALAQFSGSALPWPPSPPSEDSAEITRSITWRTSVLRSRRYSSLISSKCAMTSSYCSFSAHSALQAVPLDDFLRRHRKRRIVQDHAVHRDKRGHLAAAFAAMRGVDVGLQAIEFALHRHQCALEALHFALGEFFRQQVIDLKRGRGHQMHVPDGDAARNSQPVKEKLTLFPSPNFSAISAAMASIASASSAPSVSSVNLDPLPAASIITPMIDLAFTRRVPLGHKHLRRKCAGQLRKFGGGARVQPQLVHDFDFALLHQSAPCEQGIRITPSVAPASVFSINWAMLPSR